MIEQDGTPILYHSRLLSDSELNYSVTEKEYFAIYEILLKFLFGSPITIFTDHQAIVGLNPENHNPRVARWWERINYLTPRIKWLKGEDNEVADALSRMEQKDEEKIQMNPMVFVPFNRRNDEDESDGEEERKEFQPEPQDEEEKKVEL